MPPIYEYECNQGHTVERLVSLKDSRADAFVLCEKCNDGHTVADRVLSATRTDFVFADRRFKKTRK